MIRLLILASIGAVVSATPYFPDYPSGLESLFARKREAIDANKEESRVCESDECKLIADSIKFGIDESVDPCDDFYQYACGKWSQKDAGSENETSLWNHLENKIEKQMKEIVQSPVDPADLFAVKLAKKWFQSCTSREILTVPNSGDHFEDLIGADESEGLEPIVATLWRHGGWPMIMEKGEWDDRIYDWPIVDDHFARLTGLNTFFDLLYVQISWDGNKTLLLDTPHLPYGIYKLLSEPYHGTDTSDENNQSGEGSQEKGSKEKIPKSGEDEEDNEEDEGIEEDNEPEDEEEEESQERRVSRRKSHKRLGHNRRSSGKHSVVRQHHEARLRRPTRDIVKDIAFHKLRSQKKRAKHGVHPKSRKTGRKSTRHRHATLGSQKKSAGKNDLRTGKARNENVKLANKKKHVVHRNRARNDEENEEVERRNSNRNHGHERKSIQGSHQHRQRKHSHHRLHHAARKMEDKETDETPNDNDNENEDNDSGNEIDTDGNDGNKEDDEESEATDEENDKDENEDEEGNDDGEDNEEEEDDEEEDEKTVEELTEMYRKYMISVAEALSKVRGVEIPRDKLEKDVDDLIKFTIKVGESTLGDYDLENMTLSEFQEWYEGLGSTKKSSKVNWEKKVLKLFSEAGVEPESDLDITIIQSNYFKKIRAILDETPSEVIVNYIHWVFINRVAIMVSPEIQKLIEEWESAPRLYGQDMCITPEMQDVIGYEYNKKHAPPKLQTMARDMIDDIQKEVEYQIKESTWLDDDRKHFILDKLVHLEHLVGAPSWYQNDTMVQRYFQGLTIGTSYYENVLNYMRYRKWKELQSVLIPAEFATSYMSPLMVNAYFDPTENKIAITAADLQDPFFALNRPWNVNFGIIGSIIAHEVNHGFDDSGHLYDRNGRPTQWLSAMASAYDKRAECFVRQFNNYDIIKGDDFRVENYGNQTAGENIADTMGLEAVFRAYHRRLRECKSPDPALPGLEKFDNNQTFFLSFANLWCEAEEDPEQLKRMAKYDVHSPGRLRVIGSVSNLDGFAKSFNCPAGSPMNPEKKCNIWI